MIEDFENENDNGETKDGSTSSDDKHIIVCYKEKPQQLVFIYARERLIPNISDVSPIK